MILQRRNVDNLVEEKIITALIVSTPFCRDIHKLIKKDTFTNVFASTISQWCLDYYKKYQEAPSAHIQDVFELEKKDLDEANRNIIASFLSRLSSQFEQEQVFNVEYYKDIAKKYIKKKSLKEISDRVTKLTELDRIDEAEKEMAKYKRLTVDVSNCFDPFADDEVKGYFADQVDKTNQLFKMPGALGELIGIHERHQLLGILAPSKRGKTFWQQEFAIQAILERLRVLWISLEMDKNRLKRRLYKRVTAFSDRTQDMIYPCFDCLRNQTGSCSKRERVNKIKLYNDLKLKPKYTKENPYETCVACRGTKDFIVATWFTTIRRQEMKARSTLKVIQGFRQTVGSLLRVRAFPSFSANIKDVMAVVEELEVSEGFLPDVIIIDYADILAPEDSRMIGRERIDETWKTLKKLGDEKHCLVITASQSNRMSWKKKFVEETDAAEDIRKIANSDVFLALNQTKDEKKQSVMRVNVIAERDYEFETFKSCLCLQQLSVGQVCLDSELVVSDVDVNDLLTPEEEGK